MRNRLQRSKSLRVIVAAACFPMTYLLATEAPATASAADLSITVTAPTQVDLGTPITYQITVTNAGTSLATGVTVTDQLPPNTEFLSGTSSCVGNGSAITCSLSSVAGGTSVHLTITLTSTINGGTQGEVFHVINTVVVLPSDASPSDNSATAQTDLIVNFPNTGGGPTPVVSPEPAAITSNPAFTG